MSRQVLLVSDHAAWSAAIPGFDGTTRTAALDELPAAITGAAEQGISELFVLPAALEFDLLQREAIGRTIAEARRVLAHIAIHHDDIDAAHPLIVDALADQAAKALAGSRMPPQRAGVVLAARGQCDAESRSQSYRLMRLIWERLGFAAGEVGFLKHDRPFLLSTLQRCSEQPLQWFVVPQTQWRTELYEYAEVVLDNFRKSCPAAAEWRLAEPPGAHPALTAHLAERITRLLAEKRKSQELRLISPKRALPRSQPAQAVGGGFAASVTAHGEFSELLKRILPPEIPPRILVKVTWHGYATGTYTDPAALDLLLGALPAKAIVLEGHTSSRNLGGANFDWEAQACENRAWIRQQDAEYLRRTGLAGVMTKHDAQYVNVTEAFWDSACAPADRVNSILRDRGVTLNFPELAQFVPEMLLEHRGCPMISFAKFKGPTRLSIANMFGLIPDPLRAKWHGPNITYMARVCCDVAKLYGALFELYGIDEALYSAVQWNRQGLYRSRWGNYDLIQNSGIVTVSRGLATADILASRLQGQDVTRSAFFDVVRAELGWDEAAANDSLPVKHDAGAA